MGRSIAYGKKSFNIYKSRASAWRRGHYHYMQYLSNKKHSYATLALGKMNIVSIFTIHFGYKSN
jgi:hypothetical protein